MTRMTPVVLVYLSLVARPDPVRVAMLETPTVHELLAQEWILTVSNLQARNKESEDAKLALLSPFQVQTQDKERNAYRIIPVHEQNRINEKIQHTT